VSGRITEEPIQNRNEEGFLVAIVTIDDDLGRLLIRVASARGKTPEQFADEALRRVISENGGVR